jgi:glucan biosynthesis protein
MIPRFAGSAQNRNMFMIKFVGGAPADKAEWIAIVAEALNGELGRYRVQIFPAEKGWRFSLDWRPDASDVHAEPMVANSPVAVAFNIYQMLKEAGKPVDPSWSP